MRELALVFGLVVLPVVARAQDRATEAPLPEAFSLETLLERAEQSPRARIEERLAAAIRGDVRTAGQHPNPELSYDGAGFLGGIETNGGSQHQILLSQRLLWPGQMDRRVEAATQRWALAEAELDVLRAELSIEVWRGSLLLAAAQERMVATQDALEQLERILAILRGRAEAGAGRRWDVVRAESERASLHAELERARTEQAQAAHALAVLGGAPSWSPSAIPALAELSPSLEPTDAALHPRRLAAAQAVRAAEAQAEMERALALPPIELGVGTIFSSAPEGGYLLGHISMPIPVFDMNQGAIERAEREAEASMLARDATDRELAARATHGRAAMLQLRTALEALDADGIMPLAELSTMADTAFTGGEVSAFELIETLNSVYAIHLRHIELELTLRWVELDLLAAGGGWVSRFPSR